MTIGASNLQNPKTFGALNCMTVSQFFEFTMVVWPTTRLPGSYPPHLQSVAIGLVPATRELNVHAARRDLGLRGTTDVLCGYPRLSLMPL